MDSSRHRSIFAIDVARWGASLLKGRGSRSKTRILQPFTNSDGSTDRLRYAQAGRKTIDTKHKTHKSSNTNMYVF